MKTKPKSSRKTFRMTDEISELVANELRKSGFTSTQIIENAIAFAYGKGKKCLRGTKFERFA